MAAAYTIRRVHGRWGQEAQGIAIVIDVIRAFSVAAYALAGGARRLWLVRTVDEARALHASAPDTLLAGEVGGRLISGFHFNNSPAGMASADVRGRTLIQRTGAGTQGAVNATNARALLLCSLVNAAATATYTQVLADQLGEQTIALVPTAGPTEEEDIPAIEDEVCADYLEALITGSSSAASILADGVKRLEAIGRLAVFQHGWPDLPPEDVPAFMAVDRFAFAMVGTRKRHGDSEYIEVERVDVAHE